MVRKEGTGFAPHDPAALFLVSEISRKAGAVHAPAGCGDPAAKRRLWQSVASVEVLLSPQWLIRWGIKKLHVAEHPLIVYVHPREIDPDHPRLPLSLIRRFKCYVNLKTTMPKLKWLCENYEFVPMRDLASQVSEAYDILPAKIWSDS